MVPYTIVAGDKKATDKDKLGKAEEDLKAFNEAAANGFGARATGGSHRKGNT